MRLIALFLLALCPAALAATYDVGGVGGIAELSEVPWLRLAAGDTILLHWRPEPYQEKILICARGTEDAPITLRGIPGPNGQLPQISGINAVTARYHDFWGQDRGVIKIGPASKPANVVPAWIVVENLDIYGARPPYHFFGPRGGNNPYRVAAAAIWIEAGNHITLRHCYFHDCGNGLFISPAAKNVLVERCDIFDNGNKGSTHEHNSYTEANDIIFQYNHFGPLRPGCLGDNIKDRSAGTVVRYNWIEGGYRELDLVDAEDSEALRNDPKYHVTHVYGNLILEPNDPQDEGEQIVHYGGDSGNTNWYRKGILYFYNNTVVSRRSGPTTLFRIQTGEEKVDARNNIFYCPGSGRNIALVDSVGDVYLADNWIKEGWVKCHEEFEGRLTEKHTITGDNPGFENEAQNLFYLAPNSPCMHASGSLADEIPPNRLVNLEYLARCDVKVRSDFDDLGAFKFKGSK